MENENNQNGLPVQWKNEDEEVKRIINEKEVDEEVAAFQKPKTPGVYKMNATVKSEKFKKEAQFSSDSPLKMILTVEFYII